MKKFVTGMLIIIGGVVLLGLLAYIAGTYYENEVKKWNEEKIVGTWYPENNEDDRLPIEFAKCGRYYLLRGPKKVVHGTYVLIGNKIRLELSWNEVQGNSWCVWTLIIKEITDDRLVLVLMSSEQPPVAFRRKK